MIRMTILAVTFAVTSQAPVLAQEITAAERAACDADYEKYCKGTFPGGGRIIRCLSSHYDKLGSACKKVVDANKK